MPTNPKWRIASATEVKKLPANTIKEKDPERYKCIIQLLKEGNSIRSISRATGANEVTIRKILISSGEEGLGMSALTNKLARGAHNVWDRINEIMEDEEMRKEVSVRDLFVGGGIAADKIERLAASQVPHTVNVTQVNVTEAASINDLIASLPTAKPADPPNGAEVVDVEEVKPESADQ